jgi:hypothetical protein
MPVFWQRSVSHDPADQILKTDTRYQCSDSGACRIKKQPSGALAAVRWHTRSVCHPKRVLSTPIFAIVAHDTSFLTADSTPRGVRLNPNMKVDLQVQSLGCRAFLAEKKRLRLYGYNVLLSDVMLPIFFC